MNRRHFIFLALAAAIPAPAVPQEPRTGNTDGGSATGVTGATGSNGPTGTRRDEIEREARAALGVPAPDDRLVSVCLSNFGFDQDFIYRRPDGSRYGFRVLTG